jgi:uncharacterized protein (TIGR02246 family)
MTAQFDEIKGVFEYFANAWSKNDGAALGAFFVDTGTLVNPFGQRADGRESVTEMYSEFFGGMLGGTSTTINLMNVRDLDGDRAFVDAEQTIRAADGSDVLTVHLAALLQRENGRWKFVDARPYSYAAAPA